ncbi:MAG: WD40 repeat domain-containing protein [Fuerstiella sp.]
MHRPACAVLCGLISIFHIATGNVRGQEATEVAVLRGHEGSVWMGRLTPDGSHAVTVSADQTVRLWSLSSAAERRRYIGHTGPVYCAAISADGRLLVTGAQDNTVRLWQLPLARPIRTLSGHSGAVNALSLSPDGNILLTGGAGASVLLWDLTRAANATAAAGPKAGAEPTLFVPREAASTRSGHSAAVTAAAWRADAALMATGDAAGSIHLWSPFLNTPQAVSGLTAESIIRLSFTTGNQQLLSAGSDGEIRLWQLPPGSFDEPVSSFAPHQQSVRDMAVVANGSQVITCSADQRIVMSNVNNGQVVRVFEGHRGAPTALAVRFDNQRVAAGTSAGELLIWNAGDAKLLQTLNLGSPVRCLAWSHDHQKLVVAMDKGPLQIFGPPMTAKARQSGVELSRHQIQQTESPVTCVTFAKDDQSVWSGHDDGLVHQWTYASPTQIRQFNHGGAVYGVAITSDGRTIVSGSADRTVRLWDASSGQQKAAMSGHQGAVHAVVFNQTETFVVSSGADRTLRLWDVAVGRQLKQLTRLEETAYSVSIHPDGQRVAAAGADRLVHLINLTTGLTEQTLTGHTDYIHCVTFNSSGTRLMSYGYAGQLRVWDAASGTTLFTQRLGRIGNDTCYSPDNARILLSQGDGTATLFTLPPSAR